MLTSISLLEVIGLLGAITFVVVLANQLHVPAIVAFILAGVVVGPHGLQLIPSPPDASLMAEMAAIFLMFIIGLEFSFAKLKRLRGEFLRLGPAQIGLTASVTVLVFWAVSDYSLSQIVVFGMLISLSSTALVIKLLQDRREMETPQGRNILGILLTQDVAVIPMMLLIPLLGSGVPEAAAVTEEHWLGPLTTWVLRAAGIAVALYLTGRFLIPLLLESVAKTKSRETFFFFILFICLGAAFVFHELGMSFSMGAFIAGILISEGPYGRQATADIRPLLDSSLGLLFATVGMLLDTSFLLENFWVVLVFALAVMFLKALIAALICLAWRVPMRFAIMTGLAVCQIGEFSFILAARASDLNLLSDLEYQYFLSVSVLSMLVTPFVFRLAPWFALSAKDKWRSLSALRGLRVPQVEPTKPAASSQPATSAVLIGYGVANQNLAAAFDSLQVPYQIIEANYDTVKKYRAQKMPIHFGDGTSADVLMSAGLESAKLVVIAVAGAHSLSTVAQAVRRIRPDIHILIRAQYLRDAEEVRDLPGVEVVVAEIETSVELLSRSLQQYGVPIDEIQEKMTAAKTQLLAFSKLSQDSFKSVHHLPIGKAISSIRPVRIAREYSCIDVPLHQLSLPQRTGATIVTIYREGLGMTVVEGEASLQAGDVIHLVGTPTAIASAENLLSKGAYPLSRPEA